MELKGSEIKSFAYLDGWKGTGESYLNEQNPVNEQTTKLDSTSMNQEEKTKIDLKSQLSNIPYLSSQLIQHDHIIVVEFQSDDQRKIEEDVVVIYTWFSTKPNEANVFQRHFQNLKHFFENAKWEEICNALNVTSYFGNDTQAYWYVKTRLVGLDVATFNKIEKMAGKSHSIHNQYIFETIVNDNINPNVSKIVKKKLCPN